ncbi:hypothetical protein ACJX0J_010840, partial [Zea mays]
MVYGLRGHVAGSGGARTHTRLQIVMFTTACEATKVDTAPRKKNHIYNAGLGRWVIRDFLCLLHVILV